MYHVHLALTIRTSKRIRFCFSHHILQANLLQLSVTVVCPIKKTPCTDTISKVKHFTNNPQGFENCRQKAFASFPYFTLLYVFQNKLPCFRLWGNAMCIRVFTKIQNNLTRKKWIAQYFFRTPKKNAKYGNGGIDNPLG